MAYARKEGINITIIKITADIISRFQKTKLQEKGY
jgi:hypothetical protein